MAYSWESLARAEKRAILRAISGTGRVPGPHVVELNWQDRCNIDCFFCSTAEVRSGNLELSTERLLSLFDEMKTMGVAGARLAGGGEPLFRKDTATLIEELGKRDIRVTDVTTNGVLLTEPVARALFETGCDQITVSLNTATEDSYAAMMQTSGRNYSRVLENVRQAAEIRRRAGARGVIRLQFLIYRDNYRLIPQMYEAFLDSGADEFWFNGMIPVVPIPEFPQAEVGEMIALYEAVLERDRARALTGFHFWDPKVSEAIQQATRAAFRRLPVGSRALVKARQLRQRDREPRSVARLHEFCLVGWYSTTINANGDVVPCCILQDRKTAVLGNILRSTLAEVWFGDAYGRFREELREIMARRGDVKSFGHACTVESVCAEKGACPNRSFYWASESSFRRQFHKAVAKMPAPPGEPFVTLGGAETSGVPSPSHAAADPGVVSLPVLSNRQR